MAKAKDVWKAAPLGLGLLLIAVIAGCPSGTPESATAVPAAAQSNKAPMVPKPMLDGWPKPALAIVLSGQQHGYMEPCGCSITQSGGLSRRADFFQQLQAKGWQYASLDLGGLVRKDNLQNKLKFQVMLSALKDLGYRALAIGKEELALEHLDTGFLLVRATEAAAGNGDPPTFVSANVEFPAFKDAGVIKPAKVIEVNGHKIGVTAIFGKALKAEVLGNADDPQISVSDPAVALRSALTPLNQAQSEIFVLLVHGSHDEAVDLAKKFPNFDLVVTSGPEDGRESPERIGKTLLLDIGQKGKHVGVVGYYPDNKAQPFRFELIDLDKERFHDTPKMIARMREYQGLLEANYDSVLQDLPKPPHPSGDTFAGVETCKDCHKKSYDIWKGSKHANAFQSLITGREGAKNHVRRDHDPECLSCHTTGWEPQQMFPYASGFYSEAKTPQLKGQQCENCHGPAAKHNQLEASWKKDPNSVSKKELTDTRNRLHLTVDGAKKSLCYRCHDLDNDPNFSSATFDDYWGQIEHPFKD